jgi:hypothetical protein
MNFSDFSPPNPTITHDPIPWLDLDDEGTVIGNISGWKVLQASIDQLLENQRTFTQVGDGSLAIGQLVLGERPQEAAVPTSTSGSWLPFLFLFILVTILGLAGFGLIQLTNLILN